MFHLYFCALTSLGYWSLPDKIVISSYCFCCYFVFHLNAWCVSWLLTGFVDVFLLLWSGNMIPWQLLVQRLVAAFQTSSFQTRRTVMAHPACTPWLQSQTTLSVLKPMISSTKATWLMIGSSWRPRPWMTLRTRSRRIGWHFGDRWSWGQEASWVDRWKAHRWWWRWKRHHGPLGNLALWPCKVSVNMSQAWCVYLVACMHDEICWWFRVVFFGHDSLDQFERQLQSALVAEEIEACNTISWAIVFWHHGLFGRLALWPLMVSVITSQAWCFISCCLHGWDVLIFLLVFRHDSFDKCW